MCRGKCGWCFSGEMSPSLPWVTLGLEGNPSLPADGGNGLRCGGRTAPYGRKALGITIFGGKSLGVVAAAGCSPRPCSPKGRLCILVPEPALGLVRLSGASGSTCGAGGDEDDAGG